MYNVFFKIKASKIIKSLQSIEEAKKTNFVRKHDQEINCVALYAKQKQKNQNKNKNH